MFRVTFRVGVRGRGRGSIKGRDSGRGNLSVNLGQYLDNQASKGCGLTSGRYS